MTSPRPRKNCARPRVARKIAPSLAASPRRPRLTAPTPRPQPLPEGQRREWEDWEYSWMTMMPLGFVLYGIAYYNRPYHSIDEWARARALERMAAKEAAGDDEDEE